MHDVALRPAAVLQQVAGGQDAQQASGLGEGCAAHAQQLSCSSTLEGARKQREHQQSMQEVIWERAHNVADAPERVGAGFYAQGGCGITNKNTVQVFQQIARYLLGIS